MAFNLDPVYLLNFALCIVILMLGAYAYRRKKSFIPLLIGVAFGLFAISHLMALLDLAKALETPLIVIRALAYLTVIFALYKYSVQMQTNRN
jgi:hypothetical protein